MNNQNKKAIKDDMQTVFMGLHFIFHVVVCTFHVVKCTYHDVEYKN